MAHVEAVIDSLRYAIPNGQWMMILKRKDADTYLPICMDVDQIYVILKAITPGHGFLWVYKKFMTGQDIRDHELLSLVIDRIDGNIRARLMLRKDTADLEVDCHVDGALALAFRKRARIYADESSFN